MQAVTKFCRAICLGCLTTGLAAQGVAGAQSAPCDKPVYLTFDTGHMGVAPLVSEVLSRKQVQATFFLANEPTLSGGSSLDEVWAPWWRELSVKGHAFASHTFDHVYWSGDLGNGRFRMRATSGPDARRVKEWTANEYCAELARSNERFEIMTGQTMLPLFRAPGGRTSAALLQAAASCGYAHAGWAPAGFLGDELSSEQYPNAVLLERALRNIRTGDILMAHLGIWSRQDPWAPVVLEPLIEGLQKKGFCFATLERHPAYRSWIAAHTTTVVYQAAGQVADGRAPAVFGPQDDADVPDPAALSMVDGASEQSGAGGKTSQSQHSQHIVIPHE